MAEDKAEGGGKKGGKKDKSKENKPVENGEDVMPDFSDPEDFVDDITDEGTWPFSPAVLKPYCAFPAPVLSSCPTLTTHTLMNRDKHDK